MLVKKQSQYMESFMPQPLIVLYIMFSVSQRSQHALRLMSSHPYFLVKPTQPLQLEVRMHALFLHSLCMCVCCHACKNSLHYQYVFRTTSILLYQKEDQILQPRVYTSFRCHCDCEEECKYDQLYGSIWSLVLSLLFAPIALPWAVMAVVYAYKVF